MEDFVARTLAVHKALLRCGYDIEVMEAEYFAILKDGHIIDDCATLDQIEGFIKGYRAAIDKSVDPNIMTGNKE